VSRRFGRFFSAESRHSLLRLGQRLRGLKPMFSSLPLRGLKPLPLKCERSAAWISAFPRDDLVFKWFRSDRDELVPPILLVFTFTLHHLPFTTHHSLSFELSIILANRVNRYAESWGRASLGVILDMKRGRTCGAGLERLVVQIHVG